MTKLSDRRRLSCEKLDTAAGSQLLKATLTVPYTSLKVDILIKPPKINFDPVHPKCDQAPSLLMTHDSSEAIATGVICNPFCEVPRPCLFKKMANVPTGRILYRFLCHCPVQTCNDLFVLLQTQMPNSVVRICDILMRNYWLIEAKKIDIYFVWSIFNPVVLHWEGLNSDEAFIKLYSNGPNWYEISNGYQAIFYTSVHIHYAQSYAWMNISKTNTCAIKPKRYD